MRGDAIAASPLKCGLASGLHHLLGREEVAIDCAHIDEQAVVAIVGSGCEDHSREAAGHIFINQRRLEYAFEGKDADAGLRRRPIAIGMESRDRLPKLSLIVELV